MNKYLPWDVNLSKSQKKKIIDAIANNCGTVLKFSLDKIMGGGMHDLSTLYVTPTQMDKIRRAQSRGTGIQLKLSKNQLQSAYGKGLLSFVPDLISSLGSLGGCQCVQPPCPCDQYNKKIQGDGVSSVLNTLSNHDIEDMLKDSPSFTGCKMKDQYKGKPGRNKSGIVNLHSTGQPGSHWVMWYNLPDKCVYIDSYGLAPPKKLESYLRKGNKELLYNDKQFQHDTTASCGLFCCYLIKEMDDGVDIQDLLLGFTQDDMNYNERLLQNYFTHGRGILFKSRVPKAVLSFIEKHGGEAVMYVRVNRSPINSVIKGILNVVSFNNVQKVLKQRNYDDLFHLYLTITTNNGTRFRLEKNEVINITKPKLGKENKSVPLNGNVRTVLEMWENTKVLFDKRKLKFAEYDPKTNNCQVFVNTILQANGYGNKSIYSWVKQDTDEVFKQLGGFKKIMKGVTNFAADLNVIKDMF